MVFSVLEHQGQEMLCDEPQAVGSVHRWVNVDKKNASLLYKYMRDRVERRNYFLHQQV